MPAAIRRIQPWHTTVFLRVEGVPGALAPNDDQAQRLVRAVRNELIELFSLFVRVPNRWSDPPL